MKNYRYVGLIIILIVFGLLFIPKIIDRVANNTQVESNRSVPAKPMAYIKLNGEAKKVPEFLMLNQDSLLIGNEDFIGKVYLAEFFFTRCPTICPIMNENMKVLDARFGDRQDFGIASFTIDPDNDKPHVLKQYSENYGIKSQNWHFLTDKKSRVYELANSGFSIFAGINPAVAGGFEHQGYFALIDKNGYIRSRVDRFDNPIVYYSGLDLVDQDIQGVDMLLEDVELLLKE
ncbi:MAG: SCO family protein [Flavobacteriaceae bacterium TMED212]|nr:MAG: SCO family protein [Flavobacteriaceae bacterium TMED212]|tara:strand:- start:1211 stop:1906 length:696 start_codon:yes stop_codon:yes gene_type:complete